MEFRTFFGNIRFEFRDSWESPIFIRFFDWFDSKKQIPISFFLKTTDWKSITSVTFAAFEWKFSALNFDELVMGQFYLLYSCQFARNFIFFSKRIGFWNFENYDFFRERSAGVFRCWIKSNRSRRCHRSVEKGNMLRIYHRGRRTVRCGVRTRVHSGLISSEGLMKNMLPSFAPPNLCFMFLSIG